MMGVTKNMTTTIVTINENYPYALLLLADPSRDLIDNYLATSQVAVYQLDSGEVAGVIVWQKQKGLQFELLNLAVAEAFQGQGIASQLIKFLIQQLQNEFTEFKLVVKTGETSSAAIATYKKAGFKQVAVNKNYFTEHYPEPIYENGQHLKDQLVFELKV